jgi:hypothetical protein
MEYNHCLGERLAVLQHFAVDRGARYPSLASAAGKQHRANQRIGKAATVEEGI